MLVVTEPGDREVVAFYAWCMASIDVAEVPARWRRGAGRYPQPVALLARLGVDASHESRGLGAALLADAIARLAQLSDAVVLPPGGTRGEALQQAGPLPNVGGQRSGHNIYLLDGTKVTDKGLSHLRELKQLQFLSLFETRVTDAGVAALQKSLPRASIAHATKDGK